MSERGSFCTEYIGCSKCLSVAKKHLLEITKYLCSQEISSWQPGQNLPIIAGKIGGLYASEEIQTMRTEFGPKLAKELCHNVRIVVMAESGETAVFEIRPAPTLDLEKAVVEPVQTVQKDQIDQSRDLDWLATRARELGWVLRPKPQDDKLL